jgi:hypothetical protein
MTTPSGPLDVFHSAARSVLGRTFCFFFACILGTVSGYLLDALKTGVTSLNTTEVLWMAMSIVPLAIMSAFMSYGAITFPICFFIGYLFIRFEKSFWWLLTPFTLVASQTYLMLNHASTS